MKKDKITKNIMDKVLTYEKSHTSQVIEIWLVMLLGVFSLLVLLLVDLMTEMSKTGATDLIYMMVGDWELAKDYGETIWQTIEYELPWLKIMEVILLSIVIGIFLYLFSKRIALTRKKWAQMKKYFDDMEK